MGEERMNAKIEDGDIELIHALHKEGLTQKEIAEKFEISSAHISKILRGLAWASHPKQQEVVEEIADPLNNLCECGAKAVVVEDGKYECGTCWAKPRKSHLKIVKHLGERSQ
jgi:transcriptional regulator with XRE-family HTH domain